MQALVDDMNAKVAEIKLGMFMDSVYFFSSRKFYFNKLSQLWGERGKI